jgi:hypothetical protein
MLSTTFAFTNNNSRIGATIITNNPSQQRSSSSSSSALNILPSDIADAASLLSMKYDVKNGAFGMIKKTAGMASSSAVAAVNPDVQAQVLGDASYFVMDAPKFIPNLKVSKLRMSYAQLLGRLMIIGIGSLPGHGFHTEEIAVQLFLLSVSMRPILRSITLFRCIASSGCVEECSLELEDLQSSLYIETDLSSSPSSLPSTR